MKIAVFEVEEWELPAFDEIKKDHEVVTVHEPLNPGNAGEYADADIVSTFIYSELRKGTLEKLNALKLIATRSTGFDHIDLGYCREHGVTVSNVPHYGETTVAEHVFGLLLTISHRLADAIDRTRKGDFSQTGLRGFDLLGKTLGVVGTGGIGRHVIDIAKGFSMDVIAFDVAPDKKFAEER
ncbi:MAG TPA: NAD(P)-dependent oxidoreductase, partial [Nitrospirota bacterium]